MVETLLGWSGLLIYGRVLDDITLDKDSYNEGNLDPPRTGRNNLLLEQLRLEDTRLARIFGYVYGGEYYQLDAPAIFLVHGDGESPEFDSPYNPGQNSAKLAQGPATLDRSGMAIPGATFSEDIKVWSYDEADFTVRLDVMTGTFADVLLSAELPGDEDYPQFGGGKVGGGKVGGGKVGGGKVGGGKVGGGKVGGGKVGGGKVGGG